MTLCSVASIRPLDTTRPLDAIARRPARAARAARAASKDRGTLARLDAFEPLPDEMPCSLLLDADPHDETLEIEITEDMVNLALEAVENEQVWPYAADRGLVARPCRLARIIRFPGC